MRPRSTAARYRGSCRYGHGGDAATGDRRARCISGARGPGLRADPNSGPDECQSGALTCARQGPGERDGPDGKGTARGKIIDVFTHSIAAQAWFRIRGRRR